MEGGCLVGGFTRCSGICRTGSAKIAGGERILRSQMTKAAEVIVIGGGIIGLSIALELRWRGLQVLVLTQDYQTAAANAAAGMLAPQAEEITPGALLDLCTFSRSLYAEWTTKLTMATGLDTGYWECGILAPRYVRPTTAQIPWLNRAELVSHLPTDNLSAEVVGGYWFDTDGQVDNRALYKSIQVAAALAGVQVQTGMTVKTQDLQDLSQGVAGLVADRYILATGAWSQELLPVPVVPKKGQLIAVQAPPIEDLPLNTVLFGTEIYIVPRRDGRIVIGATSEDVGFATGNTNEGVQGLFDRAIRLCPVLAKYPVVEQWWGFRPATPDELPILGHSADPRLILATGHYRNGILLAPATAQIIADLLFDKLHPLLLSCEYHRFLKRS
jgi:glycine oxidase